MNKKQKKQIEKITKILCADYGEGEGCFDCPFAIYPPCYAKKHAQNLYNAGYREQTDTAREIFAEIKEVIKNNGSFDELDFINLQMKYAEGGAENG